LMHVDTDETIPVPSVGLALRYVDAVPEANPFQFLVGGRQVLPYDWSGCTGVMMPLLGPGISPSFARCLHDWLALSNEPLMARTAGKLADGPACSADVDLAIRLSWKKAGEAAEPVALSLGDLEVLSRMGQNDVRADVIPKIKALATLGELSIDGVARNGTLKFSGNLAQAPEGSKS